MCFRSRGSITGRPRGRRRCFRTAAGWLSPAAVSMICLVLECRRLARASWSSPVAGDHPAGLFTRVRGAYIHLDEVHLAGGLVGWNGRGTPSAPAFPCHRSDKSASISTEFLTTQVTAPSAL